MVLTSAFRPLARSLGPIASRSRGLSSLASASAVSSLRNYSSRSGGVTSRQAAAHNSALPGSICRSKLGPTTSTRSLTGFPREKVKVLMVLYDGGKHAEEVSSFSISFSPEPLLDAAPTAILLAPAHSRINWLPRKAFDLLSPPIPRYPMLGQTRAASALRCAVRCALPSDGQLFWGPADWLQRCGVAFLGESRGRRELRTI